MDDTDSFPNVPAQFRRNRIWLAILLIVVVLLSVPATGWIVVQEAEADWSPPRALSHISRMLGLISDQSFEAPPVSDQALNDISAKYSNDYQIKLACALEPDDNATVLGNLRRLARSYPARPSLCAHILRYLVMGTVTLRRPDQDLLLGTSSKSYSVPNRAPLPSAANLESFDTEAAKGERLDPSNAYFPLMRSIGLFQSHRDAEAIAAIQRASSEPRWDDYVSEDVESRVKLHAQVLDEPGAIESVALLEATYFPHVAKIRAVAQLATYEAVQDEHAGRIAQGLAIRESLQRCGKLMMIQSSSMLGSLTGMAVIGLSIRRPGGVGVESRPGILSDEQSRLIERQDYIDYLHRIHEPQDVAAIHALFDDIDQVRKIRAAADQSPVSGEPFVKLIDQWIFGLLLFTNVLWFAGIGIAASCMLKLRGQWVIVTGLCLLGFGLLTAADISLDRWLASYADILSVTTEINGQTTAYSTTLDQAREAGASATFGIPILFTVGSIIAVLSLQQQPLRVISRGASVMALIVLAGYSVIVVETACQEAREASALEQCWHHEGAYLARQIGQPWPQ